MTNYILCYPSGAGGRFLSAVLYHISNKLDEPVLISEQNSGHEAKCESGFSLPENISVNFPNVFNHLTKINNTYPTVFCTHAFPVHNLLTKSEVFSNSKLIIISYDEDDYITLLKNTFFKAIVIQIREIINSNADIALYGKKLHYSNSVSILQQFENTYGYTVTENNIHTNSTMKNMFNLMLSYQKYYKFHTFQYKHPLSYTDSDCILTLKYKDIFEKTDTSYVALDKLSKFTGCEILPNVLSSYHQYVEGQHRLMQELSYL